MNKADLIVDELVGGLLAILFLIGMIWVLLVMFTWWLLVLFGIGGGLVLYEKVIFKKSLKKNP